MESRAPEYNYLCGMWVIIVVEFVGNFFSQSSPCKFPSPLGKAGLGVLVANTDRADFQAALGQTPNQVRSLASGKFPQSLELKQFDIDMGIEGLGFVLWRLWSHVAILNRYSCCSSSAILACKGATAASTFLSTSA